MEVCWSNDQSVLGAHTDVKVRRVAMYDAKAPSSLRVVAELAIPGVQKALLRLALKRTRNLAQAEDLVAEALMRVMAPDDLPWDDTKGSFLGHMARVMTHVRGRQLRAGSAREVPDDGLAIDDRTLTREPAADVALERGRSLEALEELTTQLLEVAGERNPLARQCLELSMQGITEPEEQADVLACTVEEIYEANRFLKRHGERLRDEQEAAGRARMHALREAAIKKKKEEVEP
jgi:DNA-directed RNA polymerase specialized sigma24 family protein